MDEIYETDEMDETDEPITPEEALELIPDILSEYAETDYLGYSSNEISYLGPEEIPLITQNMLDLRSIVWENIVLEVPLRVIKEDASFIKQGDGWNLVDKYESQTNSPFSELSNLLDMEGKE